MAADWSTSQARNHLATPDYVGILQAVVLAEVAQSLVQSILGDLHAAIFEVVQECDSQLPFYDTASARQQVFSISHAFMQSASETRRSAGRITKWKV